MKTADHILASAMEKLAESIVSQDGVANAAIREAGQRITELSAEVERWKDNFIPFLAVHAGNYGREHYGEGCMHYAHYDMLAEAGGRMDDFKRCGDPSESELS